MIIEGIILAAGMSTRTSTNKLLLDIMGKTMIERAILSMYNLCSKIIVVGGHRIEDIWIYTKQYSKVELIYNENHLDGMYSSVKVGLKRTKGSRLFIIPADYPFIKETTYTAMSKYKDDIIIPRYNNKNGHPLLINGYLKDQILQSPNHGSLRSFIKDKEIRYVDIHDSGILVDIDTIEDYNEALNIEKQFLAK